MQKHVIHIIYNMSKLKHKRHLFKKKKVLNVYQFNILNNVMAPHKISNKTAVLVFHPFF